MRNSPFDHHPDRELGAALEAALSADDDRAFADRVVAAAERLYGDVAAPWWTVLTGWARPGLVAALILVATAGFWLGIQARGIAEPGDAISGLGDPLVAGASAQSVPALLAGTQVPDMEVIMAAALGN
ncbi:MAG: hypothetical protein PVF27_01110 [Gemmatimonadales bacterium]|jgi:hypothetical protein